MHKRTLWLTALVLVTAVVAMGGCAKPPEAEIEAARQAMASADTAEAQTWAPEAYQEAQAAMDAVQTEINAQAEKFALTRSYDEAKRLVAEAQATAEAAQQAAIEGREAARNAAQAALETGRATLEQASTLLTELEACKRRPKGFETDVAALRATLEGLQAQHAEAQAAFDGGDYQQAQAGAEAVQAAAATLVADLENAKTKLRC
jgi:chromosome segregation ATPase